MVKPLKIPSLIKRISSDFSLPPVDAAKKELESEPQVGYVTASIAGDSAATTSGVPPIPSPSSKLGVFAGKKSLSPNLERLPSRNEILSEVESKEQQSEDFVELSTKKIEKYTRDTEILSLGRKMKVVPKNVLGPKFKDFSIASDPAKDASFVPDALRGRLGSFWALDNGERGFSFINNMRDSKAKIPMRISYRTPVDTNEKTDFGRTEEWVDIRAITKWFQTARSKYSKAFWKAYVTGKVYNGSTKVADKYNKAFKSTINIFEPYYDHVHEMPLPFSSKELKKMETPLKPLVCDIRPEYNFYIKNYENKIGRDRYVFENTLPNMYVFLSQLKTENPNPEFNNFITLDGTLETETGIFVKKEGEEKFDIKKHPIGQYYDLYSRQYDKAKENGTITRLNRRFANILLDIDDVDMIKQFNDKREMFPMYVDVEFSTDKTTTFAQMLKDANLTNAFVSRLANRVMNREYSLLDCKQSVETIVQGSKNSNPRKSTVVTDEQKRYWDIGELLKNLIEAEEELNPERAIYLGDYENQIKSLSGKEFDFYKTLMFTIFFGKLQRFISQKFRTFKEVMDGKEAYSETVMYRVAKYDGNSGEIIQNYFFPNSNEIDILRLIDTQVKYNKKYKYVVYAYQMVIGNRYEYKDVDLANLDQHAVFKVVQEPSLLLFEHTYCEFNGAVLDDPPVKPDINLVPYKGYDDQVLMLFNGNVGNFVDDPIAIEPEDEEAFRKIREEKKLDPDDPIRFKADDHTSRFEVFRTEKHPASYSDFSGNKIASVRTDVDLESLQDATSAAFIDNIEPNKKYYYTFRAVDNHGHFSNPTEVYRIEMINEKGMIFLLKDVVEFAEKPKIPVKRARRYIQLVPSILQTLINEEKSGFDEANSAEEIRRKIHLGVTDESLWGKTFRIRLTSKSTGKKLDLKVNFEHIHKEKA
jgi:hypothetical protein